MSKTVNQSFLKFAQVMMSWRVGYLSRHKILPGTDKGFCLPMRTDQVALSSHSIASSSSSRVGFNVPPNTL